MSSSWRNLCVRGAMSLLVAASLYHNVARLRNSAAMFVNRPKVDEVSSFEMRFIQGKQALSANGYQKIGYLTDKPEAADWFAEYFRTQYALAPVVVGSSSDLPVVITNLHDSSLTDEFFRSRQLSPTADYGNGVLLLKRSQ